MRRYLILIVIMILLAGCSGKTPPTFTSASSPVWLVYEVREDLDDEEIWQTINEIILDNNYQIEFIDREIGYVRTGWRYSFDQDYRGNYRSMVEAKLSSSEDQLKVKIMSQYRKDNYWTSGTDSKLVDSIKADIMGHITRISR